MRYFRTIGEDTTQILLSGKQVFPEFTFSEAGLRKPSATEHKVERMVVAESKKWCENITRGRSVTFWSINQRKNTILVHIDEYS